MFHSPVRLQHNISRNIISHNCFIRKVFHRRFVESIFMSWKGGVTRNVTLILTEQPSSSSPAHLPLPHSRIPSSLSHSRTPSFPSLTYTFLSLFHSYLSPSYSILSPAHVSVISSFHSCNCSFSQSCLSQLTVS